MKKTRIYILTLISCLFLSSCGTIKEGFSSNKNKSEEFLVEKKSPLVMPPNFDELPIPKSNNDQSEENSNNIKSLISSDKEQVIESSNNDSNQNLESSILKKIKNN